MSTSKVVILFTIVMLLLIIPVTVFAQTVGASDDIICFDLHDTQEVARCLQDRINLRQLIEVKNQHITNLEKENELLKREIELKDKIIEIDRREIESTRRALNDMKEVTDRALKLAETSKPQNPWWKIPLIMIGGVIAGIALAGGL